MTPGDALDAALQAVKGAGVDVDALDVEARVSHSDSDDPELTVVVKRYAGLGVRQAGFGFCLSALSIARPSAIVEATRDALMRLDSPSAFAKRYF